jgi:ubiquinone/menaquinone biosynthesis C-methylase UbiE
MATTTSDPKALAQAQFTRPDLLESGLDLVARYATDPPLVVEGMMRAVAPATNPWRLLEAGFGTGWLLELMVERYPDVKLFGIDLSASMVESARDRFPTANIVRADMEAVPFDNGAFDCTASCCALYFARDIEGAILELARVTRKGGRVVINTVGSGNLKELDEFSHRVLASTPIDDIASRFDLESGIPLVRKIFPDAVIEEWAGTMTLPDAQTFVRYWATFHHREIDQGGASLLERVSRISRDFARSDGTVVLTRRSGAFIATV